MRTLEKVPSPNTRIENKDDDEKEDDLWGGYTRTCIYPSTRPRLGKTE